MHFIQPITSKFFLRICQTCLILFASQSAYSDPLSDYVATCKAELGFTSIPQFDCRGIKFRTPENNLISFLNGFVFFGNATNDFVSHRKINDAVDAVFACRWVDKDTEDSRAATGEMILHNRRNGKTCFFELDEINRVVPVEGATADNRPFVGTTNPPSPTDANASQFWKSPKDLVQCTQCHSAGPYIASPKIVSALSTYGLINDVHDIKGNLYQAVGLPPQFNFDIENAFKNTTNPCANNCHIVGGNPAATSGASAGGSETILPSINYIIESEVLQKDLGGFKYMPPNYKYSDYRWMSLDRPSGSGDGEFKSVVHSKYPDFYCDSPLALQAKEVDRGLVFSTDDTPDVLESFNSVDGLVCKNASQLNGKVCEDYATRYLCDGSWTAWKSQDRPNATGDHELRSTYPGLCANPEAIQARFIANGQVKILNGPYDRLFQFNTDGLYCRNADQPRGRTCKDYSVRFLCP